jgi:hypothetical protein
MAGKDRVLHPESNVDPSTNAHTHAERDETASLAKRITLPGCDQSAFNDRLQGAPIIRRYARWDYLVRVILQAKDGFDVTRGYPTRKVHPR